MVRSLAFRLKQFIAGTYKNNVAQFPRPMLNDEVPGMLQNGLLLQGRTALVTGAGPNIGAHIARELAQNGAEVHVTDLNRDWLDTLTAELATIRDGCSGLVSDVASASDRQALLDHLASRGALPDLVVNNVGTEYASLRFPEFETNKTRSLFEANLIGPLELTSRLTSKMIKARRPGSVLFISSIHQDVLHKHNVAYSASKSALKMVVKELAYDLALHAIRVNGIAPGYVTTKPVAHSFTPLYNRPVAPDYIARATVALASDYFSLKTTGTVLTIDGGLSLHSYLTAF